MVPTNPDPMSLKSHSVINTIIQYMVNELYNNILLQYNIMIWLRRKPAAVVAAVVVVVVLCTDSNHEKIHQSKARLQVW